MMRNSKRAILSIAWAIGLLASPALAQTQDRLPSSFAVVAPPVDPDTIRTARPRGAFLTLDVRPVSGVTLEAAIPDAVAISFGAKKDVPFTKGMTLYGVPERPGLYCDLLRPRGLGISAACLQDVDRDGAFDQGIRIDFNSARGDLLLVSHSGKIIGVRFNAAPVRLAHPVRYAPLGSNPTVRGKLVLRWQPGRNTAEGLPTADIWISSPDNYTGTEGLSEQVVTLKRQSAPLEVELYGVRLRVLGFTEKNEMQYQLLSIADGAQVPLVFRGYILRFLFY